MTFEEVDKLLYEVTDFLLSCEGVYRRLTGDLQANIMFCLVTGLYILCRGEDGQIQHFLCYWKVSPEDVELIADGMQPRNKVSGSVLYIVEHGNKAGKRSVWEAIRELRQRCKGMQGLIFNHKGEGVKYYPSQKGA